MENGLKAISIIMLEKGRESISGKMVGNILESGKMIKGMD